MLFAMGPLLFDRNYNNIFMGIERGLIARIAYADRL